jgi:hypothetical protein
MSSFVRIVSLCFLLTSSLPAFAIEDTPENRGREADLYLQIVPPEATLADISKKLAATMPPAQQDGFIRMMTQYVDINRVTAAMRQGLVKTFTADEIHAIAGFYASPLGRSAMSKMGTYMAETTPAMLKEVQNALAKVHQERAQPH